MNDDQVRQVASISLFAGLDKAQHEALASIAAAKSYAKGQTIFFDGSEAVGFHGVLEGRARVFKLSAEGKEQILEVFGPGDTFGEAAAFAMRLYPAHADALEECKTLFFPRQAFRDLVGKHPTLALNMLADLSRRLHRFTNLVEELSLKEVPGRLAAHLLYLSERQGDSDDLTLELPKVQLASLLGTIPETLSRILARMTREGFIESAGQRQIRILDRASLEEIANAERRLG
jgi:CRP/FNR family transcriptional regulator